MAFDEKPNLNFELAKLNGKREFYFSELHELYELSKPPRDKSKQLEFLTKFKSLGNIKEKIFELTDLINDISFKLNPNFTPDYQVWKTVEGLKQKIEGAATLVSESTKEIEPSHFKLPKICLPEFSGEILEWPMFFQKFTTLIHNNPSLDNFSKLHYLLGTLKGKALDLCAGIVPDPSNYEVVVDILKSKFDNKRFLADTYFRKMLELKSLSAESATALSHLVLQFDTAYKSLCLLNIPDLMDYCAAALILTKLDPQTRREFETSKHNKIPSYPEVLGFLQSQIEAISQIPKKHSIQKYPQFKNYSRGKVSHTFVSRTQGCSDENPAGYVCPICSDSHSTFKCESFTKLKPSDRLNLVKDKNLCTNCLSNRHSFPACKSSNTCKFCQNKHHTLLHADNLANNASNNELQNFCTVSQFNDIYDRSLVLLPTAVIIIDTPSGPQRGRFLVDSASQSHCITAQFCHKFDLNFDKQPVAISGLGRVTYPALGQVNFTFSSLYDQSIKFDITAIVVNKVTDKLPTQLGPVGKFDYLNNCNLADPNFAIPGPIDGILGTDIFAKIIKSAKISGPLYSPMALETSLGYIVMGQTTLSDRLLSNSNIFCAFSNRELTLAVRRFWELEEIPNIPLLNNDDVCCEDLYLKTTKRDSSGRYSVHLPFKEFPPNLGESQQLAKKRFLSLERNFKKSSIFASNYAAVIQDYIQQGHMSLCKDPDVKISNYCYLPHFAVFKESCTTPLRVVFDASAKTTNFRSLNNAQFKGPKLQNDIVNILINFRSSAIALIADIRQMYRNINVTPKHRRFQRIFWRFSTEDPLQTYEINCVVFGMTSAPYLALRTIQQLARDEIDKYPLAAKLTDKGMYVDDLVVSLDSVQEAKKALFELEGLFTAGGFKLTKWASNSFEVLKNIPKEDQLSPGIVFEDSANINQSVKILGLKWEATSDAFLFSVNNCHISYTKRGVLSTIARIWDPLGFLAPVTLFAKYFVKELWLYKIDWDQEISGHLLSKWVAFLQELPLLERFYIPRFCATFKECNIILVGFSDSSEKGYGAVIYVRSICNGTAKVTLLCAKSKVAPMKVCSLPRLELCGAVLLARLMGFCCDSLSSKFPNIKKYAFTDSIVTLFWIKNEPCRWKTFVANRVAKIQSLLEPGCWFHIRSADNVADCLSRGQLPGQLLKNKHWLEGPPWLKNDILNWPISVHLPSTPSNDILEKKPLPNTFVTTTASDKNWFNHYIQRYSSWKRLLRITSLLLRFGKRNALNGKSNLELLDLAEAVLVRQVQRQYFENEFYLIENEKLCSPKMRPLTPFIVNNILRVGGRLSNAAVNYVTKHPVILPRESYISFLIVDEYHRSNLHTGPNLVLALVRQKFWILGARNLVRKIIRSCNFCFKIKPKNVFPEMANLPTPRVLEAKPFLHSGVDFAGPFQISISRHRGVKSQKGYLCLFVCLATKAIHLELASSLSTDTFMACFKRFISRRGPVSCLYSDRGTNFIGAKAELDLIYKFVQSDELLVPLRSFLEDRKILWKFNPPHAPHFGGLWEGNIRAVKFHLIRAIGQQILSYEEFNTVIVQIETLLNSRPLYALSSDPAELEALTPSHFLTLTPLRSLPLTDLKDNISPRTRKELLDSIIKSFWNRWHTEYLTTLQTRQKWQTPSNFINIGTVVVVKYENSPPLMWPLGIITQVHPGKDGIIRVATVKVGKSYYQRPVTKLCPLPTQ